MIKLETICLSRTEIFDPRGVVSFLVTGEASTTLAECVFAAVFQGFAFGNMGTAGAAAEG